MEFKSIMNPDEFSWTEDQQITVINPTPESFTFQVHSKQYELGAGKTAKMPGYIAWVYVYNQAVRQAQADGKFNRWNEEDFRPTYYDKFVVGVDDIVQTVQVEPEPEVHVFDSEEQAVEADPPSNAGESYVSKFEQADKKAKRGRPVKS